MSQMSHWCLCHSTTNEFYLGVSHADASETCKAVKTNLLPYIGVAFWRLIKSSTVCTHHFWSFSLATCTVGTHHFWSFSLATCTQPARARLSSVTASASFFWMSWLAARGRPNICLRRVNGYIQTFMSIPTQFKTELQQIREKTNFLWFNIDIHMKYIQFLHFNEEEIFNYYAHIFWIIKIKERSLWFSQFARQSLWLIQNRNSQDDVTRREAL